jgi:hypothetical protein
MSQWEYRVETAGTDESEIQAACDEAGKQDWELVSVIVVEATPDERRTRLIFKRSKA